MKTLTIYQRNNRSGRKVQCTEVHSLAEFANWLISVHSEDDHYITDKLGNLYDADSSEIDNEGNVIHGKPIVDHADLQDSYWLGDHTYFVESDTDEHEPWEICTPTPETKSWALHYSNSQGVDYVIEIWHGYTKSEAQAKFEEFMRLKGFPPDAVQGVEAFWGQDQWYYEPEGEEHETDF